MAETYDTILQVARRLFIQQGYTATSIRQIAEEAQIGKATVYHHFPDKQTIILALLRNTMNQQGSLLEAVQAESDPRRRIEIAVRMGTSALLEGMDVIQIVRREIPDGRDQMQPAFMTFFREFRSLLGDAIREGIEQGRFRPIDPADAARVLMTMMQGSFAASYLSGERFSSPEQTAALLLDVFFHGIERVS